MTIALRAAACLFPLAAISFVYGAEPWAQPFASDTRAIVDAANRVSNQKLAKAPVTTEARPSPDAASVYILLDERRFVVDRDGRIAATVRKVYRVLSADAVDDWGLVEQHYQPWYEKPPEIRARVISASGSVHQLDKAIVTEAPSVQFDATMFSDSRVVRAPLPAVEAGAVVEYEITVRDKFPLLEAGVSRRIVLDDNLPTLRFHVLIESHPAVPLQTVSKLIPDSAIHRESNQSGTRFECEWGPIPARGTLEAFLPPEAPLYPYIAFSTGQSWQAVAAAYERIVDKQLMSSDVASIVKDIDLSAPAKDVVARLTAKLHEEVRYTGVEFGEAAIVPARPAETLSRKYGDCKDKSVLLVAMLRAAGIPAYVALLDSSSSNDVDRELPGMGVFDHAIVYSPLNPPMWIDATASRMRAGSIPAADQGRLALIAKKDTTTLTPVPDLPSAATWETHVIEVRLSPFGYGEFVEDIEAGGSSEATLRAIYAENPEKAKTTLESYVKNNFSGKLRKFEVSSKLELAHPFRLHIEAEQSKSANTGLDDAAVVTYPWLVFGSLPYALSSFADGTENVKRAHDFLLPEAHRVEYRYRIVAPPGFKVAKKPASRTLHFGPALFQTDTRLQPDGSLEIVTVFDTGTRRLTPAVFEELRDGVKKYGQHTAEYVTFTSQAGEWLAIGETAKALDLLRESAAKRAGDANAHLRLSQVMLGAGLGDGAMREAKAAVAADPKSSLGWQVLAAAYESDIFGRRFRGSWNAAEAEKCLRKAIELDPDDQNARLNLGVLLEYDAEGFRYTRSARLPEAVAVYRDALKKTANIQIQNNLTIALLYSGQMEAAVEESQKATGVLNELAKILGAAVSDGAATAIVNAQSSFPDLGQRSQFLQGAAETLLQMRRYDLAVPFMNAAARSSSSPQLQSRADMFAKLKRYEDVMLPASDPRSVVQRMMVVMFSAGLDSDKMNTIWTRRKDNHAGFARAAGVIAATGGLRRQLASTGLTSENILDLLLSSVEMRKEGSETRGYIVRTTAQGREGFPPTFVSLENGEYRILGSRDTMEHAGELVLELLESKDIEGAQWWLDQLAQGVPASESGTGFPAISSLWSGTAPSTRGPDAIRVAAASLIGSKQAIQTLREARGKATPGLDRAQLDKALCEIFAKTNDWAALAETSKRLAAFHTFSEEGFRHQLHAARALKNWKDLETIANARLSVSSTNLTAMRAMVDAKEHLGDPEGAATWLKKLRTSDLAGSDEILFEAWNAISHDAVGEELLARLRKLEPADAGANFAPTGDRVEVTIAMAEAKAKRPERAQQALTRALGNAEAGSLNAATWIAYAGICRAYGFPEDAQAALGRSGKAPHTNTDEISTWALASLTPAAVKPH